MQLDLSELFLVEGMVKEYQVPVEMPYMSWGGKQYPLTDVKPVSLRIVHLKNRNLELSGVLHLHVLIPCDRCLLPVNIPFDLEISKDLNMNATDRERAEALDEQPFINGNLLDTDRLVYEELVVNMPMKVLCKETCKGICNRCGANLNTGVCGCDVTELDPRMSVIRDIFKNTTEE